MAARRRVHLVRHGEAHNPRNVIYGRLPGFPLSELGRRQVAATAAELQRMVTAPLTLLASPLERARQTAAILGAALGVEHVIDERLIEAHGAFDGRPRRGKLFDVLRRAVRPSTWSADEPPAAVVQRMREAVTAALDATANDVVIVSHQFPIAMARVAFEHRVGEPDATPLATRIPWLFVRGRSAPASVTTLVFADGELADVTYWCGP